MHQPIYEALTEREGSSIEEALTCLSELIYYQDTISDRMWAYFQLLVERLMKPESDKLQACEAAVVAVLINLIHKAPEQLKSVQFPGQ